jgi:alpha-1,2-mannosyltransferase
MSGLRLKDQRLILPAAGVFFFVASLVGAVAQHQFAMDFHHSYWPAGRAVLDGHSPFLQVPDAALSAGPFIYPPVGALLMVPFGLLPHVVADVVMTAIAIGSILGALYVLGVRDLRCYGAALFWFPVYSAVQNANLSALLVLALALIWRYRDRVLPAALVIALCVAVKLFLWPLFVWLAVTRRWRTAFAAAGMTVALSVVGWLVVGFGQLHQFLHVLSVADRLGQSFVYTPGNFLMRLGVASSPAHAVAMILGVVVLAAVVVSARRPDGDRLAFTFTIAAALLLSPIVWIHYFTLLLVPLAIGRPGFSRVWLLPAILLFVPSPPYHPSAVEIALVLGVVATLIYASVRRVLPDSPRRAGAPEPAAAVSGAAG